MSDQTGGGAWSHVEGDHLVDDSGRIRDPSEIDVDRLERIVMLQVSALPDPTPDIDRDTLAADLAVRLSTLPAPDVTVGRPNVEIPVPPVPTVDAERLAGGVDRIPDNAGGA